MIWLIICAWVLSGVLSVLLSARWNRDTVGRLPWAIGATGPIALAIVCGVTLATSPRAGGRFIDVVEGISDWLDEYGRRNA